MLKTKLSRGLLSAVGAGVLFAVVLYGRAAWRAIRQPEKPLQEHVIDATDDWAGVKAPPAAASALPPTSDATIKAQSPPPLQPAAGQDLPTEDRARLNRLKAIAAGTPHQQP